MKGLIAFTLIVAPDGFSQELSENIGQYGTFSALVPLSQRETPSAGRVI